MSPLSDGEYEAVRNYLVDQAGLVFDESRRAGLAATLADRLRASGDADVGSYLGALRSSAGEVERQRLLDAVTVQETHFFRNPPQMEALRRRVLPELLRRAAGRERPLTIWSAGCSTGEEPYTLAMLLLELSPMLGAQTQARILGSDVSGQALEAAARATYTGRTLDAAPPMVKDRWMEPQPGGSFTVKAQARRLVELRLHNLVTEPPPFAPGEVDLIVCRNVTIYFGRETTATLIGGFHTMLAEGGYLILGHSETLWQMSDAFDLVPVGDAFVYRRSHEGSPGGSRQKRPARRVAKSAGAAAPAVRGAAHASTARRPAPAGAAERRRGADELAAARMRLAAGDYDEAAGAASRAVAADPLLAAAYVVLGQARSTLGHDKGAIDPLRKAVYLDPAAGHAHFLLAGALSRTGQHAPAAVSYRAAARALEAMTPQERAELLDGRDAGELPQLCERLAVAAAAAAAGHAADTHRAAAPMGAPGGGP